jgi:glycosyltransferase involved in cell wall biosynthesis
MMRARAKLASYRHLAASLRHIADRDWHLAIVGDGEARAEVEAAFAGFGEGRVRFLGIRPPEALPSIYAAADLLVWPGIGEAYGMTYLEAGAMGLAAVATRSGGVANVVEDGVSGVLVGPDDPADFAAAIAALLDDPDVRVQLGRAARVFVREERGLDRAAAILDDALRPLAGEHGRAMGAAE